MEGKKYIAFLVGFYICLTNIAQTTTKENIYKAYISGDMVQWKNNIIQAELNKAPSITEKWFLLEMYYGYIAWCIGNKRKKEADNYIIKADRITEELQKTGNNLSSVKAYKAALIGYKIGLANYKAPFLGPKGQDLAKESVKLNSNNPIALIELGNVFYFAPSFVGGSKTEAIKNYEKAAKLMEEDDFYSKRNWRYLNLLTFLYQAYTDENNVSKAATIKIKIETIEPKFQWIKNLEKTKIL